MQHEFSFSFNGFGYKYKKDLKFIFHPRSRHTKLPLIHHCDSSDIDLSKGRIICHQLHELRLHKFKLKLP